MSTITIPILVADTVSGTYDAGLDVSYGATVDASFTSSGFSAAKLNSYFKYNASTVNGAVAVTSVTYTAGSIAAADWSSALSGLLAALPAKVRSASGLPAYAAVTVTEDATSLTSSMNTSFGAASADNLLAIAKQKPAASWVAGSAQSFVGFAAGDNVKLYIQFSGTAPTAGAASLPAVPAGFGRALRTAIASPVAPFVWELNLTSLAA